MNAFVKRVSFTFTVIFFVGILLVPSFFLFSNAPTTELVIFVPDIINERNNIKFKKDFIQLKGVFDYKANLDSKTIQLDIDASKFNINDIDKIFLKWGYENQNYFISKFIKS